MRRYEKNVKISVVFSIKFEYENRRFIFASLVIIYFLKNTQQNMLSRKIITTKDGASSIHIPEWNEQYHSTHGAIQEARHVYLESGLFFVERREISILEIGLGTGLNCFLTFLEAEKRAIQVNYTAYEAYPVTPEEVKQLNYIELLSKQHRTVFERIHRSKWSEKTALSGRFCFEKRPDKFQTIDDVNQYDLIYFDAFGPRVQPELWTEAIFHNMYQSLKKGGVLVTYSSKGSVRRAMLSVGFKVEKIPGPPGKREMLRAVKVN